jgi:hypothetical protein
MHFEDRMDLSGKTVGQYQIIESIGQGGRAIADSTALNDGE